LAEVLLLREGLKAGVFLLVLV